MLEAALILELGLDRIPEAGVLVALLGLNAALAQFQEHRARAALELLRRTLRINARVLRDGEWASLPASELVPGDRIHLKMGDMVPADCRLVRGEIEVDQAALTGESAPVARASGATLYSSSIVRRGEADAEVTATGSRTAYGRTADLVRTARSTSHLETLLFGIVRYLVVLDVAMALLVITAAGLRGVAGSVTAPFVVILLIASVPVAMPATFTIANAIESRRLVEQGVLVTGLTAVQEAASMDVACVDKTGTLTEGRERLSEVVPFGGRDADRVLALASSACDPAEGDSIDLAILDELRRRGLERPVPVVQRPFDPALKRSESVVRLEGTDRRVVLGSPAIVFALCPEVPPEAPAAVDRLARSGARVLAVAVGTEAKLGLAGLVALSDRPRPEAAGTVTALQNAGIRVVLLTGDTVGTARSIARQVGLGERMGGPEDLVRAPDRFDGFAGVFPEDKFRLVRGLQAAHHVVGMTGDGVNDAPALKQAEVGIAVANATDVARASAKVVLTRPGLSDMIHAVEGGRRVYRRMLTWTLRKLSLNFEIVFLLAGGFLVAGVFVTTPFLVLLMVFANDFVAMAAGSDNVRPSSGPDRWNLPEMMATAAVIAVPWIAFSFGLLWWGLSVAHLAAGTLQTLFFVYLVFGSQGTILLARERGRVWDSRPSTALLVAIAADIAVVSGLAVTGLLMPAPIAPGLVLGLLGGVAGLVLAVDQLKVAFIRWARAFGPSSRFLHPAA
jgi:H+-transporting ATPase